MAFTKGGDVGETKPAVECTHAKELHASSTDDLEPTVSA